MKFWVKYRTVFLYVGKNKFTYSPKFIFQNVLYIYLNGFILDGLIEPIGLFPILI